MRETIAGLLTGFIFGLGLCLSRMTDPAVVQGFLDIAGAWDPTLMFVMGGGVAVAFVGYRYVMQRKQPLWAPKISVRLRPARSMRRFCQAPLSSASAGASRAIVLARRSSRLLRAAGWFSCSWRRWSSA